MSFVAFSIFFSKSSEILKKPHFLLFLSLRRQTSLSKSNFVYLERIKPICRDIVSISEIGCDAKASKQASKQARKKERKKEKRKKESNFLQNNFFFIETNRTFSIACAFILKLHSLDKAPFNGHC